MVSDRGSTFRRCHTSEYQWYDRLHSTNPKLDKRLRNLLGLPDLRQKRLENRGTKMTKLKKITKLEKVLEALAELSGKLDAIADYMAELSAKIDERDLLVLNKELERAHSGNPQANPEVDSGDAGDGETTGL